MLGEACRRWLDERPTLSAPLRDLESSEELLSNLFERARAGWPDLEQPEERFLGYVVERLPDELEPDTISQLCAADLWLACACAHGQPDALRLFEAEYVAHLGAILGRFKLGRAEVDEVGQELRSYLLVAEGAALPRIRQYRGRGSLAGWFRVTAVRFVLRRLKAEGRRNSRQDVDLPELMGTRGDPELSLLQAHARPHFKGAFEEALQALDGRERTVLRQRYIDSLSSEQIGAIYDVHRTTAARWIADAQKKLLETTRVLFAERTGVSVQDCDSLIRACQSQLELSLPRLLA